MSLPYDAFLLVSFGGPEGPDEVMPFLENVTRGRGIPRERLEEVAHHYLALGGVSPINAQNRALVGALEEAFDRRNVGLPVYWGNRNWEPFLAPELERIARDGHRHVLALATSAYASYSGCRQYREDLARAVAEAGLQHTLEIDKIRHYFDHPGFITPFADGRCHAHPVHDPLDPACDGRGVWAAGCRPGRGWRLRRAAPGCDQLRRRRGGRQRDGGPRVVAGLPVAERTAVGAVARAGHQ
jgi:hypothetical protein